MLIKTLKFILNLTYCPIRNFGGALRTSTRTSRESSLVASKIKIKEIKSIERGRWGMLILVDEDNGILEWEWGGKMEGREELPGVILANEGGGGSSEKEEGKEGN
jgi:hypothetical protein